LSEFVHHPAAQSLYNKEAILTYHITRATGKIIYEIDESKLNDEDVSCSVFNLKPLFISVQ